MRSDADVVSSDEIKGSFLMMLSRNVLEIIRIKYLYALISYDMPTRIETYPFYALRDAFFNALMHNDWSSGQSILIMVEKFGTGITKILDACKSGGNPHPAFSAASDGLDFSVTLMASKLYCALDSYRKKHEMKLSSIIKNSVIYG